MAYCRQALGSNPMSGTFFVFINRAKTMVRVLAHDGTGMWLMTKRISNKKFTGWPTTAEALSPLTAKKLMRIIRSEHFQPASTANGLKQ
jgi:transposase